MNKGQFKVAYARYVGRQRHEVLVRKSSRREKICNSIQLY